MPNEPSVCPGAENEYKHHTMKKYGLKEV